MLEGHTILVVDDEANMVEMLADLLRGQGARVSFAADLQSARARIAESRPDVILLDMKLPDGNGLALLGELKESPPAPSVIMISAFGTVETAVKAVRAGAFDFIVKPFNIEDILRVIRSALLATPGAPGAEPGSLPGSEGIVGESRAIREVLAAVRQVTDSDAPVLIRGESGTGKELVARAVHFLSPRRSAPLMPINCAAIPEPLLESELFGYEKGAFSGAFARHAGKIEAAEGGTVFLDEIGDMSTGLQAKLLRALEQNVIYPVGSTKPVTTNVRFVAATNHDLETAVQSGDFREDLYFRLNVLSIDIPPLRERSEDIPVLVEHFLKLFTSKYHKPDFSLPPGLVQEMEVYPWPGNVRELRNVMEKLVILGEGALPQLPWRCMQQLRGEPRTETPVQGAPAPEPEGAEDAGDVDRLTAAVLEQEPDASLTEVVKAVERAVIVRTLNLCEGNRRAAANKLGVSYKTLFNKLNEHDIQVKARAD